MVTYCRSESQAFFTNHPKSKDLRNCLPTFAVMQGLLNDVWEQYLGHAPRTVTARHYIPRLASASIGESEALERQMELFSLQVIFLQ